MDVLVDILLTLLGRAGDALPFGPLKEACEALFRAFAEQVTPQGFGDMVRVVRPAPEGQDEEEDDDDDMFEEEGQDDDEIAAGMLPPKHIAVCHNSLIGTVSCPDLHVLVLFETALNCF